MASRFETFSEDYILAINEAVVETNTKKATHLQQNCKNALDKIPEMFVNCKQSFY